MGQGGTLFHKGVTSRVPQVPRNLSFHPRGEHVFPPRDRGPRKKSKFIYGYIGSFDPLEDFSIFENFYYMGVFSEKQAPCSISDPGDLSCAAWHPVNFEKYQGGTGGQKTGPLFSWVPGVPFSWLKVPRSKIKKSPPG